MPSRFRSKPFSSLRFAPFFAVLMFLVAAVAVTQATRHYGPTIDEGAQIAAGMQWLDQHRYAYEPSHPPLARVVDAAGAYIAGARSTLNPNMWREGEAILWSGGDAASMLLWSRLGVLLFLLVATVAVWRWSRSIAGPSGALASTLLFLTLPPVLAHAGLATTDMAVCGMSALAYYMAVRWLARPSLSASLGAGVAGALALISKFTAALFFPAGILPVVIWRWWQTRGPALNSNSAWVWLRGAVVACIAAALVIWAGYGFSTGSLLYQPSLAGEVVTADAPPQAGLIRDWASKEIYPAPAFLRGLFNTALRVDKADDPVYLLGNSSRGSVWYFFPVVFAVKTPLPFLILAVIGIVALIRQSARSRDWQIAAPALVASGIFAASLASPVDLGSRYLLPIYPPLAIAAGSGLVLLARSFAAARVAAFGLTVWAMTIIGLAYPDYLPWFNELAGPAPERVAINSDLDWGQDVVRLDTELRSRNVDHVQAALLEESEYELGRYINGYSKLAPDQPATGWIAVSQFMLHERAGYEWLREQKPVARIGHSILLYNLPSPGDDTHEMAMGAAQ